MNSFGWRCSWSAFKSQVQERDVVIGEQLHFEFHVIGDLAIEPFTDLSQTREIRTLREFSVNPTDLPGGTANRGAWEECSPVKFLMRNDFQSPQFTTNEK